jgi:hypothetical protein
MLESQRPLERAAFFGVLFGYSEEEVEEVEPLFSRRDSTSFDRECC